MFEITLKMFPIAILLCYCVTSSLLPRPHSAQNMFTLFPRPHAQYTSLLPKLHDTQLYPSSPDSVHNDGERHIPYIMIFPNSTLNKLIAWGKYQVQPDQQNAGMITEELRQGYLNLPYPPRASHLGTNNYTFF